MLCLFGIDQIGGKEGKGIDLTNIKKKKGPFNEKRKATAFQRGQKPRKEKRTRI